MANGWFKDVVEDLREHKVLACVLALVFVLPTVLFTYLEYRENVAWRICWDDFSYISDEDYFRYHFLQQFGSIEGELVVTRSEDFSRGIGSNGEYYESEFELISLSDNENTTFIQHSVYNTKYIKEPPFFILQFIGGGMNQVIEDRIARWKYTRAWIYRPCGEFYEHTVY